MQFILHYLNSFLSCSTTPYNVGLILWSLFSTSEGGGGGGGRGRIASVLWGIASILWRLFSIVGG